MCQIFVAFSEYLNFKKLLLPTLDFRWSFPLFLSASIIKLSQSYSLHRFSKKILFSIDHTGHGGFFCTPGSWLKQIMRSWSILTFFSSQRGVSVRHINLHTFSRDSWKSQKEKKVRAFEQMFQSHNSTGIPKFVNANRLNQKSTTLLAFYWFF